MIRDETDINFNDRSIFLPAENTKGKKDRYVFFSQTMETKLRRWLQYRDRYKDSEFCFCTTKGKNIEVRSFERKRWSYQRKTTRQNRRLMYLYISQSRVEVAFYSVFCIKKVCVVAVHIQNEWHPQNWTHPNVTI